MAIRLRILFISLQRTTWTHTGEADPDITAPTDLTTTPAIITTVTMATVTAEAPGMCFKKNVLIICDRYTDKFCGFQICEGTNISK